jgi:hypothetical protein
VTAQGFKTGVYDLAYDANKPERIGTRVSVASTSETVEVTATTKEFDRLETEAKKNQQLQQNAASSNVYNLQKRVAGVLPVRVDVPRAGASYHFVRPLVLDEVTQVTFTYRSR